MSDFLYDACGLFANESDGIFKNMEPVSRILVGDDLEREKKPSLAPSLMLAASFAEVLNAELYVLHVYSIPKFAVLSANASLLEGPYIEAMTKALDEQIDVLNASKKKLRIVPVVKKGEAAQTLIDEALARRCQLIVAASRSEDRRPGHLGAVAERLLHRSPLPVLTFDPARPGLGSYRPKKILVPVDLIHDDRLAFVEMAVQLAQSFHASLRLLHILEEWAYPIVQPSALLAGGFVMPLERDLQELALMREEQLRGLAKSWSEAGIVIETHLIERARSVGQAITQEALQGGFDLIVSGHHQVNRLESVLLGSVNRFLVRESPCPLITVPVP